MAELNITPMVDVMLVLLVIFMVAAPMMQQGVQVNLPSANAKALQSKEEPLTVTVNKEGLVFLDKNQVAVGELRAAITKKTAGQKDKAVLLNADKGSSYGDVVKVMAEIKGAGIEKLGMATAPGAEKGK